MRPHRTDRGRQDAAEPPEANVKKASRVSDLLEEVLAAQGLRSVTWMVRLSSAWPGIVGPLLAGKTSPVKLRNRVLTVLVHNHAWAQELQLRKPDLLERINGILEGGKATDIRFAVGPLPSAEPEEPEGLPAIGNLPAAEPEGVTGVADPETREILRSLARKALSRTRG
jgi:predicted nucleic acid-binding Zn ribbon protein